MTQHFFGRIESPDIRDELFPVSSILPTTSFITEKYWYPDGWWGNQGQTTHCVAFSWLHWIEDGPVVQDFDAKRVKPMVDPKAFYTACRDRDGIPGTDYLGTSVRAGAKVLKELGLITEYRWATNINEVINTLLNVGPMVVGTKWFKNMNTPNAKGIIDIGGTQDGGHAYVLNGIDTKKGYIRIKNSWGRDTWGVQGHAFIKIDDFQKLLASRGEACIALEKKLKESINLNKLIKVTD